MVFEHIFRSAFENDFKIGLTRRFCFGWDFALLIFIEKLGSGFLCSFLREPPIFLGKRNEVFTLAALFWAFF